MPQTNKQIVMLEYPYPVPLADGSVQQVAEGILWARMPMPMALDHINIYFIEDDDGWYAVDTGLCLDKVKQLWHQVVELNLSGKPLKGLICTHFHYDHAGLAPWITQTFDIPLYMTFGEYFFMRGVGAVRGESMVTQLTEFYRRGGVPEAEVSAIIKAVANDPFVGQFPNTFNRLREGDQFAIGSRTWQVVVGEGHSPEHACLWCKEDGIFIAGDQLLPEISSNVLVNDIEPNANPLARWLVSLARLQQLPENTLVLPAHGPAFRGASSRAADLIVHHKKHLDRLLAAVCPREGITLYQALKVLFNRPLGPVEKMLALGEAAAHLNYLCGEGKLEKRQSLEGGDEYYKRTQQDQETQ